MDRRNFFRTTAAVVLVPPPKVEVVDPPIVLPKEFPLPDAPSFFDTFNFCLMQKQWDRFQVYMLYAGKWKPVKFTTSDLPNGVRFEFEEQLGICSRMVMFNDKGDTVGIKDLPACFHYKLGDRPKYNYEIIWSTQG